MANCMLGNDTFVDDVGPVKVVTVIEDRHLRSRTSLNSARALKH